MSENEDDEEMGEDQEEDILVQGGREAENNSFGSSHFSLSQQIITNLKRQGLTTATEVQHQVIPKIQNERGKDLCVNAPTGSGKTLAYALPIIEVVNGPGEILMITEFVKKEIYCSWMCSGCSYTRIGPTGSRSLRNMFSQDEFKSTYPSLS